MAKLELCSCNNFQTFPGGMSPGLLKSTTVKVICKETFSWGRGARAGEIEEGHNPSEDHTRTDSGEEPAHQVGRKSAVWCLMRELGATDALKTAGRGATIMWRTCSCPFGVFTVEKSAFCLRSVKRVKVFSKCLIWLNPLKQGCQTQMHSGVKMSNSDKVSIQSWYCVSGVYWFIIIVCNL